MVSDGTSIRRRRECVACGYSFSTREKMYVPPIPGEPRPANSTLSNRPETPRRAARRVQWLEMLEARRRGRTFASIAGQYGVTRQRVQQIVKALLK